MNYSSTKKFLTASILISQFFLAQLAYAKPLAAPAATPSVTSSDTPSASSTPKRAACCITVMTQGMAPSGPCEKGSPSQGVWMYESQAPGPCPQNFLNKKSVIKNTDFYTSAYTLHFPPGRCKTIPMTKPKEPVVFECVDFGDGTSEWVSKGKALEELLKNPPKNITIH